MGSRHKEVLAAQHHITSHGKEIPSSCAKAEMEMKRRLQDFNKVEAEMVEEVISH